MMTKKYFREFALMLLWLRENIKLGLCPIKSVSAFEKDLMALLSYDNPNFSREKFLEASGGDDE